MEDCDEMFAVNGRLCDCAAIAVLVTVDCSVQVCFSLRGQFCVLCGTQVCSRGRLCTVLHHDHCHDNAVLCSVLLEDGSVLCSVLSPALKTGLFSVLSHASIACLLCSEISSALLG